jgi:ribosomal protein L6P/L9E
MNKIIKKIPYNIKLHIVYKFNFNYLFVFGWIGFIKYRLKKSIVFSVKQFKLKLLGIRNIYYTYLKLLNNFYSWTSSINKKSINLNGVGFKFKLHENRLFLVLGFSHLVKL